MINIVILKVDRLVSGSRCVLKLHSVIRQLFHDVRAYQVAHTWDRRLNSKDSSIAFFRVSVVH